MTSHIAPCPPEHVTVTATIRRCARRLTVRIVAADQLDRVVSAVQSTFANSPTAQREAIAWCKRKGVHQFTITH